MSVRQRHDSMKRLLAVGAIVSLVAACSDGSGSSGFDAKFAEDAAITQALAAGRCVTPQTKKPIFCPADVASPSGGPGTIDVGTDSADLPCSSTGGNQCSIVLPFMPEGLPTTATYRVATRTVDPPGRWHIGAAPAPNGTSNAPDFDGTGSIDLPAPSATPGPGVTIKAQFAVLVFLAQPASVPTEVKTLADSGADFAYISEERSVLITP